ncbi:MAG: hypothetical protein QNL33_09325 [Akkermansiaceae bacterium]|jgi:hypothetical protein
MKQSRGLDWNEKDLFEVVLYFGVGDQVIRHGKSAESRLRASLRAFGRLGYPWQGVAGLMPFPDFSR